MPSIFQWPAGGPGWWLTDARLVNQTHPDTFWVPPTSELEDIRHNDVVKVIANFPGTYSERIWVLVTGRFGDFWHGEVDSCIQPDVPLKIGDTISFLSKHIIDYQLLTA